jgi:hypothetical protein
MPMLERLDREGFWLSLWLGASALMVTLWPDQAASLSMCFTSILLVAYSAGKRLLPASSQTVGMMVTAGSVLGMQSLLLTVCYYASIPLGHRLLSWATLVACGIVAMIASLRQDIDTAAPAPRVSQKSWFVGMAGVGVTTIIASFVLRNALAHATEAAIRSPWPYLHPLIPLCIGILFLLPVILSAFTNRHRFLAPIAFTAVLVTSLLASLVYQQGFGFDGFLHRESAQLLFEQGILEPKPYYYIGQYVLTVWAAQTFDLPVHTIDRYLLSALVLFFIAAFVAHRRQRLFAQDALLFLFIPLSWLAATTPQSLAYLFGLAAVLLHPRHTEETHSYLPAWIFAFWSLATHPLAGLPFAAVVAGMTIIHKKPHLWRSWMSWFLGALAAFAVPAAFFVFSAIGKQAIIWDFAKLLDVSALLDMIKGLFGTRVNASLWPDWVDLVAFVLPLTTFVLAIFGSRDKEQPEEQKHLLLLTASGIMLFVAGYLMRTVGEFSFLIAYERGNYADRLFAISLFLLALPAAKGLSICIKKPRPALLQGALLSLLILWQSAHVYAAFPRHDAGAISHGWSVGAADKEAVLWIDRDANGLDYTVLANQSMSAAAVESLGFKRYADDVFFYPIPTGGELYQLFLRASAANPSIDLIKEAGQLSKAKRVYVAIHRYWWDAERVRGQLKDLADNEETMKDGEITIYRFDLE